MYYTFGLFFAIIRVSVRTAARRINIKAYSLLMLCVLAASFSLAQSRVTEKEAVAYAKAIDVKKLDSSLASQGLEDWLRLGPPHAEFVRWTLEYTCDLKPVDSNTDYPLCVKIGLGRGGQYGEFLVEIGSDRQGIVGAPHLHRGVGVFEKVYVITGSGEHLSDLPSLLDQPVVAVEVQDLFAEIVTRHPIGVPKGAEKTVIWPLLSKRLTHILETAQACQDDYFRQHPIATGDSKPAWINSGLFVGDGKRASPLYENPYRKEPQKDGSFWVYVDLTYVKLPGFVPDQASWRVIATVIRENNRFVVDDVRLFDGLSTDGPFHLLSDSFVGCDGPRWVGVGTATK